MVLEVENDRKSYRNRIEIVRDILQVVGDSSTKKTHIMYGANLSYKLLIRYLEYAMTSHLIECDSGSCYLITTKGKTFLKLYGDYEKRQVAVRKDIAHLRNGKKMLEDMLAPLRGNTVSN